MSKIRLLIILIAAALTFQSCRDKNEPETPAERTLIMYFPWSTDLTSYFENNIDDMKEAIARNGLDNQRVIVYFADSPYSARLFKINADGSETALKSYTGISMTEAGNIASMLGDIANAAPANRYSMIIGCHGSGWLPVIESGRARTTTPGRKYHWDAQGATPTRFFGGRTAEYQTEISTLREGIEDSGLKMEYILFDDCYMSNVEVAYELRNVTGHLIASTSEIMVYGMPYDIIGGYLLGEPDYERICSGFYDFYSSYSTPCGSIAVTDCSQMEALAEVMREINSRYTFDTSKRGLLQILDGYSPTIFFDMESYAVNLCDDPELIGKFNRQMQLSVIAKACTPTVYTALQNREIEVETFSGLTISDPTANTEMTGGKLTEKAWYKATH